MGNVTIDLSGFDELKRRLKALNDKAAVNAVMEPCVNKMAQVYIATAKKNTPVGKPLKVMVGGKKLQSNSEHMRRSWDAGEMVRAGNELKIMVFNSASYASYVNDGHRQTPGRYVPTLGKRLVKNFVQGLHMAEAAERQTGKKAKAILKRNIDGYLARWNQ